MWMLQTSHTVQPHYFPLNFRVSSFSRHQTTVAFSSSSSTTTTLSITKHNPSIQSLCERGQLKLALKLLHHEPNPTQRTYELLIQSCANKHSLSDALVIHRNLIDNGFDQDPFLATKLINMYCELNCIDHVRQVFDETLKKTIYIWNALFRALTLSGHGEEVLGLYRRMNRIGVRSDRFTYTYVLKACVSAESLVSLLKNGKEIHAHILRHGYESHIHIMTTLVDMYARFGCVEDASSVFNEMPGKNVVSWSAMIACYAKNGKPFEALEFFRELMLSNNDTLPNSITMVSVLQACASLAAVEQGKLLHGYVLRKGPDSILPVISALVTVYARCGDFDIKWVLDSHYKAFYWIGCYWSALAGCGVCRRCP